ncbi:ABC-2 transporter permease [Vandammella animalimorsus]|uniref:ABC-2 transporter permease n=1 Tax=Vandammella animalimorsus TaxID=2029117 RepID=UPI0015536B02|nr:ABC-2 transporter permease [Vandammella animalimorsus]
MRAHSVRWLLVMAALVLLAAWLAANFSARQPATVALDVGLSGTRLVLMLMALFWVQELLGKDMERKSLYFVLAYPISREAYLLSRFAAVAALLALGVLILGGALGVVMHVLPSTYAQPTPVALGWPYVLTLAGLWLDLLVITAFALWLCSLSTTPFLPLIMGCLFALAARSLGITLDFLLHSQNADPDQVRWLLPVIQAGKWVLPDLSRLDWRDLALYGLPPDWPMIGWAVLMAAAYGAALLALAGRKLARRELL